jgi:4-amino-4-deoxy-L-arabinose transferase-like glycosyltransferase
MDPVTRSPKPLRPSLLVLPTALSVGFIWTLAPWLANYTLPLDVVQDGMPFGHDFQWGYYKHPPIVFWLQRVSIDAMGDLGPYLMSQVFVTSTVLLVYALGRRVLDETRAAIGALLLYGVYYFSWPTPEFNHNVAEMPLWAAGALLLHRATREGRWRDWLALGFVAGVGLLTKYVYVVFGATSLVWLVSSRAGRGRLATPGPWAAAAVAGLVFAPHVWWLFHHDFLPLHYLGGRLQPLSGPLERLGESTHFVLTQFLDHVGLFVLAAFSGLLGFRALRTKGAASPEDTGYLLVMGLVPGAMVGILPLLKGARLHDMWTAPMWNLSGLLLSNHFAPPRGDNAKVLKRSAVLAFGLMVLAAASYSVVARYGQAMTGRPNRTGWPDQALAVRLQDAWSHSSACPLRLVVGDAWSAGLVALRAPSHPQVLIDGDFQISPWFDHEQLADEGALVLWRVSGPAGQPNSMPAPFNLAPRGVVSAQWPFDMAAPPLRIAWAVIPGAKPCQTGSAAN